MDPRKYSCLQRVRSELKRQNITLLALSWNTCFGNLKISTALCLFVNDVKVWREISGVALQRIKAG